MSIDTLIKKLKRKVKTLYHNRVSRREFRRAFKECSKAYNKNWNENVISDNGILRVINSRKFVKRERQLYRLQSSLMPFAYPVKHKSSAVKK